MHVSVRPGFAARGPQDWRSKVLTALSEAKGAASLALIAVFTAHLAGVNEAAQAWLGAGAVPVWAALRASRLF